MRRGEGKRGGAFGSKGWGGQQEKGRGSRRGGHRGRGSGSKGGQEERRGTGGGGGQQEHGTGQKERRKAQGVEQG
jgi:hypothetical protein